MDKKQSVSQIFSNVFYALKFALKASPIYVPFRVFTSMLACTITVFEHTFLVAYIINCIQFGKPFTDVLKFLIPIFSIIILKSSLEVRVSSFTMPKCKEKINRAINMQLYDKAAKMDIAHYDDPKFYNNFVWSMQQAPNNIISCIDNITALSGYIATLICTGVYVIVKDPVGLVFVAASLIVTVLMQFLSVKKKLVMEQELMPNKRKRDYVNRLFYLADYAKDLRMNEMNPKLFDDFRSSSDNMEKTTKKHTKKIVALEAGADAITNVLLFDGIYLTRLLYKMFVLNAFGYGTGIALFNSTNNMKGNIRRFIKLIPKFQENSWYIQKMRTFLQTENAIQDNGKSEVPECSDIEFKDVSFKYPTAGEPTLHNISMTIPKGSKIALVGYNGAGKSTFVKLIMRLYDVSSGELLYGGKSIAEYPIENYRNKISTLFQDYQMIAATLGENITMGTEKIDVSKAERVVKQTEFEDAFNKLKLGFDTPLTKEFSNEGVILSGGEAQKIALCRVLYSNADILILDEPSSALDPLSEYNLNHNIRELANDKTIIFISHRLSTTRMADCIYMFEDGRIIENGDHEKLMQLNGKYAKMFMLQAQKYR